MRHRYLSGLTAAILALVAAALWRDPMSRPGTPDPPGPAPQSLAPASMETAATREASPGAPAGASSELPSAPPARDAASRIASETEPETVVETAPEISIPGRSLDELEKRARAGEPKAARDWVDAVMQCAHGHWWESTPQPFVNHFSWQLARERLRVRQEWMSVTLADCEALLPHGNLRERLEAAHRLLQEAFRLWAASGDPVGVLIASTQGLSWPPADPDWRQPSALAASYLDPSNPQTLVDLARVHSRASRYPSEEAWLLVACDLGYDCSAGGAMQRTVCLLGGECSDLGYEEELLQRLPPRQWQMIQRQRHALLAQLRQGDRTGVLSLPPGRG